MSRSRNGRSDRRENDAQMGVDFVTGMTLFIITLFFVFQVMFTLIEPYTATQKDNLEIAERASEKLYSDSLTTNETAPGQFNYTHRFMPYFNKPETAIRSDLGIASVKGLNISVVGDYTEYGPRDGLKAHLSFNGHSSAPASIDDAGTPEVHGDVRSDVRGVMSSYAVDVDGRGDGSDPNDEFLEIQGADSFDVGASDNLTLTAWIRPNRTNDQNQTVTVVGLPDSYRLSLDGGTDPTIAIDDTTGIHSVSAGRDVVPNEWNFVAATFNTTPALPSVDPTVKIYTNGTEKNSRDTGISANLNSSGAPLVIGKNPEVADQHYDGRIDAVRVYSQALNASEIARVYDAAQHLSPERPSPPFVRTLANTTLRVGEGVPTVSSVSSVDRVGYVPWQTRTGESIGMVQVRVRVW